MLLHMYYVKDGLVRLSNLKKKMQSVERRKQEIDMSEIKAYRSNFYTIIVDMVNALTEFEYAFSHLDFTGRLSGFVEMKEHLLNFIERIKEFDSLQDIVDAIDKVEPLLEDSDFEKLYIYDLDWKFRNAHWGYYESIIDGTYLQMIGKIFKTKQERTIRILDAFPRSVDYIKDFTGLMNNNVVKYAANVSESSASLFKSNYDRVALGTLKGSLISNEVFDILFLYPPITLDKQSERVLVKKERDMIRDTVKYLRPGGYLVLFMPHFRFYRDIASLLAKYYTDFQVRKFSGLNFEYSGIVFLVAKRKPKEDKEIDYNDYRLLRTLYNLDNIENILNKGFEDVYLPDDEKEVKFFRGSILDVDELKKVFYDSNATKQFKKLMDHDKSSKQMKSPLLPFNTGQLGLVLTSGFLDGIVDEGNGYYHVVKGRVIKKTDSERELIERENSESEMEVVETTSNRVEINVMLPDGTYKILV